MERRKLYYFVAATIIAGYIWLAISYFTPAGAVNMCLFHNVTGLPCPSCGTTRAVMALFHLQLWSAISYNPLGLIMGVALIVIPVLLLLDYLRGTSMFYKMYTGMERLVRRQWLVFTMLILANWIWNIFKYT